MEHTILLDQQRNGLQVGNIASSVRKTKYRKPQDLSQQVQNGSTSIKSQIWQSHIKKFFLKFFTLFWQPKVQPSSWAIYREFMGKCCRKNPWMQQDFWIEAWVSCFRVGGHPAVRDMVFKHGVTESEWNWELVLGFISWVCQSLSVISLSLNFPIFTIRITMPTSQDDCKDEKRYC